MWGPAGCGSTLCSGASACPCPGWVPRLLSPFTSLILVYNHGETACAWWIEVSLARASLPRVVLAVVAVGDAVVWLCWLGLALPSHPLSTVPSFLCAAGAGGEIWGPKGLNGARHQPRTPGSQHHELAFQLHCQV